MKRWYYYTEKEKNGMLWVAKNVNYAISLTLLSSFNEMHATRAFLLDRPDIYKHEIKKYGNLACQQALNIETTIKNTVKNKSLFVDYFDQVIDEAEKDIALFRIAIKQELDNARVENSNIISRAETARCFLDLAAQQFDETMQSAWIKYRYRYGKYFAEFNAAGALTAWKRMCNVLYRGITVDLNTDNTMSAFDRVRKKFDNGEYIDNCWETAIANNPTV